MSSVLSRSIHNVEIRRRAFCAPSPVVSQRFLHWRHLSRRSSAVTRLRNSGSPSQILIILVTGVARDGSSPSARKVGASQKQP